MRLVEEGRLDVHVVPVGQAELRVMIHSFNRMTRRLKQLIQENEEEQQKKHEAEIRALQSQINPQLAGHGGRVSLMEITEDGYAILQFGGGCNGCSMVDVTLKEGIEKQLLNEFPELKGVRDLTEHQRGEHSYY